MRFLMSTHAGETTGGKAKPTINIKDYFYNNYSETLN